MRENLRVPCVILTLIVDMIALLIMEGIMALFIGGYNSSTNRRV